MGNNRSKSPTGIKTRDTRYIHQKHPELVKYLEKLMKNIK